MNANSVLSFVPSAIYMLFLLGIALLETDNIITLASRIRLRHRLSVRPELSGITRYCSTLLTAAFGKSIDGIWLILGSALIFAAMFIVALRSFNAAMSALIAITCCALPFLILYVRVGKLRNRGSREGLSVVSEIFRQYRARDKNMQEAIEAALAGDGEFPVCKKQLYILLIRMRDAGKTSDIKECCRQFAYSLGTVWGKMLSVCIELSCIKGVDVSAGLSDIIEQLKTAKALAEDRKRLNGEAARMTLFLVPLLYIASIFVSFRYLNMKLASFIKNQLFTAGGLMLFLFNILLFSVNIILIGIVNAKRMDY